MQKDDIFKNYSETVFYQISLTARYQKLMILDYFGQIGLDINPDEFFAMEIVSVKPNICQRDLAKELLKDRAATGRLLVSLEEKGLVDRFVTTRGNRIIKSTKLTTIGKEALTKAQKKLIPSFTKMKKLLPQTEVDELNRTLEKIRNAIGEHIKTNIKVRI